jgi:hypothetical protein
MPTQGHLSTGSQMDACLLPRQAGFKRLWAHLLSWVWVFQTSE